jgi:hypothetical protein
MLSFGGDGLYWELKLCVQSTPLSGCETGSPRVGGDALQAGMQARAGGFGCGCPHVMCFVKDSGTTAATAVHGTEAMA